MIGKGFLWRLGRHSIKTIGVKSARRTCHQPALPSCFGNVQRTRAGIFAGPRHPRPLGYSRTLFTSSIPTVLVPPLIFIGLLLTLWTWKCFWIVLLQDKLLYLSWLPPFSRSDKIADYESECRPVRWEEKKIRSLDGTKLAVCEGRIVSDRDNKELAARTEREKSVVICYFQGNGGSTPLRLSLLSQVLRAIQEMSKTSLKDGVSVSYTVVALSYRGYWTSSGRATQSGIELDAQAFLNWVVKAYSNPESDLQIVLWGHSLGAAVASTTAVSYLSHHSTQNATLSVEDSNPSMAPPPITGLILEAPISSIKDMLISLYPQKWLPYRYLWPFSWNNWSVPLALERLSSLRSCGSNGVGSNHPNSCNLPPILLLSPEQDEVIPPWVADQLERKGKDLDLDMQRKNVPGAMHIEAPLKADGRRALVHFILDCTRSGPGSQKRNLSTHSHGHD